MDVKLTGPNQQKRIIVQPAPFPVQGLFLQRTVRGPASTSIHGHFSFDKSKDPV